MIDIVDEFQVIWIFAAVCFILGWFQIPRIFRAYFLAYVGSTLTILSILLITLTFGSLLTVIVTWFVGFRTCWQSQKGLHSRIMAKWRGRGYD